MIHVAASDNQDRLVEVQLYWSLVLLGGGGWGLESIHCSRIVWVV
jgi:hypothetical protein